jgi:hypothetical protein
MHKRLMTAYFEELARAAKLQHPKQAAETINLLQEGVVAVAHVMAQADAAAQAKALAARLFGLA